MKSSQNNQNTDRCPSSPATSVGPGKSDACLPMKQGDHPVIEPGSGKGQNVLTVTVEKKTALMTTRPKRQGDPERAHLHVGRPQLRPMFPARAEASRRLRRVCARTRFKPGHSTHDKYLPLVPASPRRLRRTRTTSENHLQRHRRPQPSEFAILRPISIILAPPKILISSSTIVVS